MEVLQADMAGLQAASGSSSSLLETVGYDVNSSYSRSMQYQVVSDNFHISTGGNNAVKENTGIQIIIRDDNAIHYLKRSGIAFDAVVDGYVHNASMFFTGLELSIGGVTVSTPFQHFYVQQKLTKMGHKKLEPYANGMALCLTPQGRTIANQAGVGLRQIVLEQAVDGGGVGALTTTSIAGGRGNPFCTLNRALASHYKERTEFNGVAGDRVKMFVPFNLLFPCIDELPDDGAVWTGYGTQIKMNLRTNLAADFVSQSLAGAAPAYTLSNMVLVKCFSILDQPRADLVLKQKFSFPLLKYVHWAQQINDQTTINALYSVQRDDLIRGLYFAFHTKVQAANTAEVNNNILANLINGVATQFKNPLSYFVPLPIQQMQFLIGGEPLLLNLQQIQLLHITPDAFSDCRDTYHDPVLRSMKYAYYIDLRRFAKDLFGSSAKQTTTVQVTITMKTGAGSRTLPGQEVDWDVGNNGFGNFQFMSFLETMSMMELRGGQYSI